MDIFEFTVESEFFTGVTVSLLGGIKLVFDERTGGQREGDSLASTGCTLCCIGCFWTGSCWWSLGIGFISRNS